MNLDHKSLVSVIVPCHGRADLLRETLGSVAAQTFPAIEVVVIDDASPEGVSAIVEDVRWPPSFSRICHRLDVNRGPGAAREAGRQIAHGEYLCYLDSDDLCHPDRFRRQVEAFTGNLQAGMCYSAVREFTALPITGAEPIRRGSQERHEQFLPQVLYGRPWCTSACLWRRTATDRIGPWFEGWTWEDYEYDTRAGCLEIGIAHIADALCFYRTSEVPDRLSNVARNRASRQRADALIRMADNLIESDRLGDESVRSRLFELLYNQSLSLLEELETPIGLKCLQRASHLEPLTNARGIAAHLLAQTARHLGPSFAARLGRGVRRRVIRRPAGPERNTL